MTAPLRSRIVRAIYDTEPVGGLEIARIFGVQPGTVETWIRRYRPGTCEHPFPPARWTVSGHDARDRREVEEWGRQTGRLNDAISA